MSNTRNRYPGRRRFLKQSAALSAGAASLATPAIVLGQGAPAATAQAVRILVGAPPGGTTDTVARAVATDMARALGQPVIVENRSGAGGNVAAEAVAHSAADGATLLVAFSSHTINATLYPALPFDPVADFTPITMLTTSPSLLIGHPAVPANSLAELVTLLQKNPGKYDFGIGAPGSSLHMAGERFKLDTGTFVGSIAYRGSAPALQDLVAGQVQLMFVSPAARPYVAQQLEGCVGRNVSRAEKTRADGCYQLTLFARDFFEARNAGVPLEQTRARLTQMVIDDKLAKDMAARLEKLAVSVYGSGGKDYGTQAPQFRTALFVECVAPRPDR